MNYQTKVKAAFVALGLLTSIAPLYAATTVVRALDGTVVWANPPAAATGTFEQDAVSDGSQATTLRVAITTKGGDPNQVQVLSQPFAMTNGQQYNFSFEAKADVPRTVPLTIRINAPDWHSAGYADAGVQIGLAWHKFNETFTASKVGTGNNVVAFSVGDQTGTVWISNLKVTTEQSGVAAVPDNVSAGKNEVANFVGAVVWSSNPSAAVGGLDKVAIGSDSAVPALRVDVATKADNPNDVQAFSQPFSLTNGQKYVLTYEAKADKDISAIVAVRIDNGDYHDVGYSDPSVAIGPTWQAHAEAFTAAGAQDGHNMVGFSLGNAAGSVWIANLKLTTDGPVNQSELPGGPGVALADIPKNAYRILFVGDSITQHGIAAPLGWDHVSGMAATSQSTDFVHLIQAKIQALMPDRPVAIRIASLIPGGEGSPDYRLSTVVPVVDGYNPDLVVIQHGEHEQEPLGADAIASTYNKMLDMFTSQSPQPKIICVGVWSSEFNATTTAYGGWTATVEQTMHDICAKRGITYVSVESLAANPADHGYGTDPGVRWHPNDAGQAGYADLIFAAYQSSKASTAGQH